jgi:hypothetical protein
VTARKRCVHPLASLRFTTASTTPLALFCQMCRSPVKIPPALQAIAPSKSLRTTVASFLAYLEQSSSDAAAQVNPRHELALILAMSNALKTDDPAGSAHVPE